MHVKGMIQWIFFDLLKLIGDFERIADHGKNILESARELNDKGLSFSEPAGRELGVLSAAVSEILALSLSAFRNDDLSAAARVEPLEQVIDGLRTHMRSNHIQHLQQGHCSIEAGFVWSDLLTNMERTADHCSNIATCLIDMKDENLNLHESLRAVRGSDPDFLNHFTAYEKKYALS